MCRKILIFMLCLLLIMPPGNSAVAETDENGTNQSVVRFVVFGHVYTDYDALRKSVEKVNHLNPEFVVFLGDTLPNNHETGWKEVFGITKNLDAPVYFVPGNHDISDRKGDRQIYINSVGPLYQAFTVGDIQFIILNTVNDSLSGGKVGIQGGQLEWLLQLFNEDPSEKIILMHHCLFYQDDFTLCNSREPEHGWNNEIVPIIKNQTHAVFNGDVGSSHPYFAYQENDIDYYGVGFSFDGLSYPAHFLSVDVSEDGMVVTPVIIRDNLTTVNSLDFKQFNNSSRKFGGVFYEYFRFLLKNNLKKVVVVLFLSVIFLGSVLIFLGICWLVSGYRKNR